MTAEIHQLKPKPIAVNWMCSACGTDASCNCGAPLMSKAQRAAEAVAANPAKSDRAIAEEIGVSAPTVGKARRESGVNNFTPDDDETRTGLDGKQYPARTRRDEHEFTRRELAERNRGSFLLRAQEAKGFAFYEGKVDEKLVEFAKETASAWCDLVGKLEKRI